MDETTNYLAAVKLAFPKATYSITPNALINWETMEVSYSGHGQGPEIPFASKSKKFRHLYEMLAFVDNNKSRIVIYDAFLPPKIELDGFAPRQGPILRYAKNPKMELVQPDEQDAIANEIATIIHPLLADPMDINTVYSTTEKIMNVAFPYRDEMVVHCLIRLPENVAGDESSRNAYIQKIHDEQLDKGYIPTEFDKLSFLPPTTTNLIKRIKELRKRIAELEQQLLTPPNNVNQVRVKEISKFYYVEIDYPDHCRHDGPYTEKLVADKVLEEHVQKGHPRNAIKITETNKLP
jgi:hypothetical protein